MVVEVEHDALAIAVELAVQEKDHIEATTGLLGEGSIVESTLAEIDMDASPEVIEQALRASFREKYKLPEPHVTRGQRFFINRKRNGILGLALVGLGIGGYVGIEGVADYREQQVVKEQQRVLDLQTSGKQELETLLSDIKTTSPSSGLTAQANLIYNEGTRALEAGKFADLEKHIAELEGVQKEVQDLAGAVRTANTYLQSARSAAIGTLAKDKVATYSEALSRAIQLGDIRGVKDQATNLANADQRIRRAYTLRILKFFGQCKRGARCRSKADVTLGYAKVKATHNGQKIYQMIQDHHKSGLRRRAHIWGEEVPLEKVPELKAKWQAGNRIFAVKEPGYWDESERMHPRMYRQEDLGRTLQFKP